ncbi:MAG: hypothetical protein AB1643_02820 [Patescibacteria group bacterium]
MEFRYKDIALIKEEDIMPIIQEAESYIFRLKKISERGGDGYESPEGFINLPFDATIKKKVEDLAKEKNTGKLKYLFLVGIGGSELGCQAIYEAIYGKIDNLITSRLPKIIFIDTISKKTIQSVQKIISEISNPEEIILNIICKSGTTFEIINNFEDIYSILKKKVDNIDKRIVIITEKESKLWSIAEEKNFSLLEIPKNISGRYSVFSPVGLFPLLLTGINIDKLLAGAKNMRSWCLDPAFSNIAILSASLIYLHNKNGIKIHNTFFSNPEMEALGKWHSQVLAESLGKDTDLQGEKTISGITPLVSTPVDFHSCLQLYLAGPKDKFTTFVSSAGMDLIMKGVKSAYQERSLPFMEIDLPEISENVLGEFMQFKMMEVVFLAKLFNVNAFDQPAVEEYKKFLVRS